MSVDQAKIVDAIGIDDASGNVVLTISDHLEWGSNDHLHLLQEKLNTYLSFVESGEIFSAYSNAEGRNVQISLVCKYPPDESAVKFLKQVAAIVEGSGMKFKYTFFGAH